MRHTLEELKAMSDAELHNLWGAGKFPFYDHLYPQPSAADTLEQQSQMPSAVGAQPDLGVEAIALPEDKLEAMRENEYDSRANTR